MIYKEIKPNKSLSPFIKCYWILEGKTYNDHDVDRILPDGCIEVIINYKEPFQQLNKNNLFERQPNSFVVGQIRNHILLKSSKEFGILGIRFKPSGAYRFFNFPMNEISEHTVDLEFIWGKEAKELNERLCSVSIFDKIRLVEEFLSNRFNFKTSKTIEAAVKLLETRNGLLPIGELALKVGKSKRQLERHFNSHVGLTPKAFSKILRLQDVFKYIEKNKTIDWITLSYISGYYDQSHFINDFKHFSGMRPSEYISSEQPLTNFFISK